MGQMVLPTAGLLQGFEVHRSEFHLERTNQRCLSPYAKAASIITLLQIHYQLLRPDSRKSYIAGRHCKAQKTVEETVSRSALLNRGAWLVAKYGVNYQGRTRGLEP